MAENTSQALLDGLRPSWQAQLQLWAQNGALVAAAQKALVLTGTPSALEALVSQWSGGGFSGLPPIVLLSNADISGAMGAYAISTGTIYLNADWLATASQEQLTAVLTEELGHHLDGLLNAEDTAGDEGEYFSELIRGVALTDPQKLQLRTNSDSGTITTAIATLKAEQAASSPILRGNSLYSLTPYANHNSWQDAENGAMALGGHLVSIGDSSENQFIINTFSPSYIQTLPSACQGIPLDSAYIGLIDDRTTKASSWISGDSGPYRNLDPYTSQDLDWHLRNGNNPGVIELNPSIYQDGVGSWYLTHDSHGSWNKSGIAEIPLTLSISRTGAVREGAGLFTTSINLSAGTQASGNLANGAIVYWAVDGITADDLAAGSAGLKGQGNIANSKLDIQHSLKADADTGEQLSVSVYSDAAMTQQIGTTSSVTVEEGDNTSPTITGITVQGSSVILTLTGTTAPLASQTLSVSHGGTGNAAANTILGNEAKNTLSGKAGPDVLTGKGGAATFTFGSGTETRTFLAINDGTAGYQASTDAIVDITGYSGLLTSLAVV